MGEKDADAAEPIVGSISPVDGDVVKEGTCTTVVHESCDNLHVESGQGTVEADAATSEDAQHAAQGEPPKVRTLKSARWRMDKKSTQNKTNEQCESHNDSVVTDCCMKHRTTSCARVLRVFRV